MEKDVKLNESEICEHEVEIEEITEEKKSWWRKTKHFCG